VEAFELAFWCGAGQAHVESQQRVWKRHAAQRAQGVAPLSNVAQPRLRVQRQQAAP
jgi:hypothetical protein